METGRQKPEAILFDLFGTLVMIDPDKLPRRRIGESNFIVTIESVEELLDQLEPRVALSSFLDALLAVSRDLAVEKRRSHVEVPSRERFRRALTLLGVASGHEHVADELSRRHMVGLSAAVVCPPGRRQLLERLGRRYPLGLVSNFDDGSTARALLARHGLDHAFGTILISDDFGRRKPVADIFLQACRDLDVAPGVTMHVGDSYEDDVCGAVEAGLDALWISNGDGDLAPAVAKLDDVRDLPTWLGAFS